jgi:hypothetical protein
MDSVCFPNLDDFYYDGKGATTDENLFEHPTGPACEWLLTLSGLRVDGVPFGG